MKLEIDNLVRQLIPPHKRLINRLSWLRALLSPLKPLFADFHLWRSDTRMMVNVNSQVKVLEGYLKKKYNQPIAIKIITFEDGLLLVCLENEGELLQPEFTLEANKEIPLEGEIRETFDDTDFIVYIPMGVDIDLIQADIEKYKMALIKYKLIQN